MNVTIYGWNTDCNEKPCPKNFTNGPKGDCKAILAKEHKFFFAFENSICKEYISEKFFGILHYNTVPVVFGDGNYQDHVNVFLTSS